MRTFSRGYGLSLLLAAALSIGGCLRKDVTHTIYLTPSDVTWSTIEKEVRSDDPDPATRLTEEQDYVLAARAGQNSVARALAAAGASRVTTSLLRSERPFAVMTEGRFADLGAMARALLGHAGARGNAAVERDGCRQTFRAWVDVEQEPGAAAEDVSELFADPAAYRLVLTSGRFVDARGFTIVEDGTVAVPVADAAAEAGIVTVSLTWTDGTCPGGR